MTARYSLRSTAFEPSPRPATTGRRHSLHESKLTEDTTPRRTLLDKNEDTETDGSALLSPGILAKFKSMTTGSPKRYNTRSIRKPDAVDLTFRMSENDGPSSSTGSFSQTTANENGDAPVSSVAGGSFLTRSLSGWLSPRKNARKSSAMLDVKESGPSVPSSPRQEKKRRQSDKEQLQHPLSRTVTASYSEMNEHKSSPSTTMIMNESDMMPVRLPEKYNYEVWEDPNVDKPAQDPKENLHPLTNNLFSGLHAFSPFKAHREARALKALDVATLPEYKDLKGHFFNDFGKSFFNKKGSLVPNRFRASKVNLFKPRTGHKKRPSLSTATEKEFEDADMLMGAESDSGPVEDTKDLVQFPSPKWAVPAQKVLPIPIPGSIAAVEPSFNSAFKPVPVVARPSFGAPNPSVYNYKMPDTPFNTPMVAFMSRSLPNNFGSQDVAEPRSSEEKMNLRPRPTRPPTLFGFASDLSEDEHGQGRPRSKRKVNKS